MNYKTIMIIFLFTFFFAFAEEKKAFNEIANEIQLESNQYLIVFFGSAFDCHNCLTFSYSQLLCLQSYVKPNTTYKIVALVDCERKKELKIFTERFNWTNYAMVNKYKYYQKNLNLSYNTILAFYSSDGTLIGEYNDDNRNSCDIFVKTLSSKE